MAPQVVTSLPVLSRRMTEVTKPTDPDGLILEAWAQGFMVGAIIIMICITLSNIRRGVLLHKLILIEVGRLNWLPPNPSQYNTDTKSFSACLRHLPWHFHFQSCSSLRMVLIRHCDLP